MASIIANIAMISKHKSCDLRGYQKFAISATLRGMDVIDGKWIAARLTGKHGEKTRLAEFMGIDKDKLAKIFSGARKVKAEEIPKIMEFFSENRMDELSERERKIIEVLRKLSWSEVAVIEATAEAFSVRPREEDR